MTTEPQKQPENAGVNQLKVIDGGNACGEIPPYAKKPIRNVKDAKKMLSKLIHAFQMGKVMSDQAKTLCYLIISYVQIIRDADFEERLIKLEQQKGKGKNHG